MNEVKSCPCGSGRVYLQMTNSQTSYLRCESCLRSSSAQTTEKEVVAAWNDMVDFVNSGSPLTTTPPPPPPVP